MQQLVLTLKESREPTAGELAQLQTCAVRIIDRIGRILRVESPDSPADLASKLPQWHVQPEAVHRMPTPPRVHVKRPS